MEFLNGLMRLLNKPFPIEESRTLYYRNIILVSVFVTLFLYVFEPFGISTVPSGKFWICLGFGSMTFFSSLVYDFLANAVFKFKQRRERFTFWKWIIYITGLILCISLANFLFVRFCFFGDIRWEYFPSMVYGTFAIGIFPVVVIGAISLLRQERKYQHIADEINKSQVPPDQAIKDNQQSVYSIPVHKIRYVEALQNYVKIGYLNDDGQLKEHTERATLKAIEDQVDGSPVIKCHRSYLVNKEAVVSASGNAQGLTLLLSECDREIPVSRSYVSDFRDKKG